MFLAVRSIHTTVQCIRTSVSPHLFWEGMHWLGFIYKCFNSYYPPYLKQYLFRLVSSHQVRHTSQLFFSVPCAKKAICKKVFKFKAPADWNNLPANIRSLPTLSLFMCALSSHLMVECSCRWSITLFHHLLMWLSHLAHFWVTVDKGCKGYNGSFVWIPFSLAVRLCVNVFVCCIVLYCSVVLYVIYFIFFGFLLSLLALCLLTGTPLLGRAELWK